MFGFTKRARWVKNRGDNLFKHRFVAMLTRQWLNTSGEVAVTDLAVSLFRSSVLVIKKACSQGYIRGHWTITLTHIL